MSSILDRVRAAVSQGEETTSPPTPTPRGAHDADDCTDLTEARRKEQYFGGRHSELLALKRDPGGVRYVGPALGVGVLVGLDREIEAAADDAAAWRRAVLRLEYEALTPEARSTFDAQAAAERAVSESAAELASARAAQSAEEERQARGTFDEARIIGAASRVSIAEGRIRVARHALDEARRAHAQARGRATAAKEARLRGEALAALDEFEEHAIPAAAAMARFEAASASLPEARFAEIFRGPFRPDTVRTFIAETRNILQGRGVDDDGPAAAA